MNRKEIVVFDFDRTLTTYDTTLDFFQFCGRKKKLFVLKYYLYLFLWMLQKLGIISNLKLKNFGIKLFIRSHRAEELNIWAKEFSSRIKLNQIYNYNFKTESSNARVIIVSAALEIYLKYLFPNVEILGTTLAKTNEKYVEIDEHIYGVKKRIKLLEMGIVKINRIYTDSKNDSSIARMSDQCNLVVNGKIKTITSSSTFDKAFGENTKNQRRDYLSILFCRYQNLGLK